MSRDDLTLLRDMLDAAEKAMSAASGRIFADLQTDWQLEFALVWCLEIIGEAAGSISTVMRERLPNVAWPQMVRMRNRMIHGHFDINTLIVWKTVREDLPPLVADILTSPAETNLKWRAFEFLAFL